jgi:hypothetical protein
MGNLIKIDDLGVPPFQEISISSPSKNVGWCWSVKKNTNLWRFESCGFRAIFFWDPTADGEFPNMVIKMELDTGEIRSNKSLTIDVDK